MAREKKITVKHIRKPNTKEVLTENVYLNLYPMIGVPSLFLRLRYDNIQADVRSFYRDFISDYIAEDKLQTIKFIERPGKSKFDIEQLIIEDPIQKTAQKDEINAVSSIIQFYLDQGLNIINNKPSRYIEFNIYKIRHIVDRFLSDRLIIDINKMHNNVLMPFLMNFPQIKFSELYSFLKKVSKDNNTSTKFFDDFLVHFDKYNSFIESNSTISNMRVFEWKKIDNYNEIEFELNERFGPNDSQRVLKQIQYSIDQNELILRSTIRADSLK